MFIIYLFLTLIGICICLYLIYKNNNKLNEIKKIQINIDKEKKEKEKLLKELSKLNDDFLKLNDERAKILLAINNEKEKYDKIIEEEKNNLLNELNFYEKNLLYAKEAYINNLEKDYKLKEDIYNLKVNELKNNQKSAEASLEKIKSSLKAATEAQLRDREKREQIDFYKLSLTKDEKNDVSLLESIKPRLRSTRSVCKLIWSEYYQKQMTELCNRVLNMKDVTGIYKITDLVTEEIYIGQAVNMSDRWKQHAKCGLGIDTPENNKLYKAIQRDGLENFSFELLEQCSKEELNEKEKFYIDLYSSNKVGLNMKL